MVIGIVGRCSRYAIGNNGEECRRRRKPVKSGFFRSYSIRIRRLPLLGKVHTIYITPIGYRLGRYHMLNISAWSESLRKGKFSVTSQEPQDCRLQLNP